MKNLVGDSDLILTRPMLATSSTHVSTAEVRLILLFQSLIRSNNDSPVREWNIPHFDSCSGDNNRFFRRISLVINIPYLRALSRG